MILGIGIAWILGVSLLMWGSLRATNAPSRFETIIAPAVRNHSIPWKERRQKNPLRGDSAALQQGRELFLTRCATCYGIDGSSLTAIGVNLSPRAPDLRQPPTKNLTDGEIHSIIEYGVRFTGMPGQKIAHQQSSEDSWTLVLFVRSLQPLSTEEKNQQATAIASAHYVGSQACAQCHAQIYQRWKKTPMANVVCDPHTHPDAILPDLSTNTVSKFTLSQVAFVYGSLWKQRYFTEVGKGYAPLPGQWDIGNHKWLPYHVPDTGADWRAAFYPPGAVSMANGRCFHDEENPRNST